MELKLGDWTWFELDKEPTKEEIEKIRSRIRNARKHEGVEVSLTRTDHNPKGVEVHCHVLVLSPKERAKQSRQRSK